VNVDHARSQMALGMTVPEWPEMTHLDITGLTAADAAARLIAMAGRLTSLRSCVDGFRTPEVVYARTSANPAGGWRCGRGSP